MQVYYRVYAIKFVSGYVKICSTVYFYGDSLHRLGTCFAISIQATLRFLAGLPNRF